MELMALQHPMFVTRMPGSSVITPVNAPVNQMTFGPIEFYTIQSMSYFWEHGYSKLFILLLFVPAT